MASEEDNFDIDIYGDGGEDYRQDAAHIEVKAEDTSEQPVQSTEAAADESTIISQSLQTENIDVKQESGQAEDDVAQKISSTDQSAPDTLQLPKQAPQTQGLKRKDGADDRPVDPGATSALFVSELNWWINDDDVRGWSNQSQCEDELEEITFSEHKVNGKSKGQAYVLFKSPQAATAAKQKIESFGEGQYSTKKFTVSYTNPYTNPFKTLPKDGPMRNSAANNNRSNSGAYNNTGGGQNAGYNNYRGNRGGGFNNRGGGVNNMSGFNRGGFQQPIATGFQGPGMGGYQGTAMGGMQSYGGFQGRGGMGGGMRGGAMGMRGGRGGMNANPMMGMPMGGMGMGGMGAMGLNMPHMGGGMGMQGMTGSHSQSPVYPTPGHGPSATSAGYSGSLVVHHQRQQQHHPAYGTVGVSSLRAPGEYSAAAGSNPSSVWASYTQYPPQPSNSPATSFLSHLPPPPTVSPPHPSAALSQESLNTGTQAHFNPAFFPQGSPNGGTGDANWNPHGAKRTRQE